MAESAAFMDHIQRKMNALASASDTADYIGHTHFLYCPACSADFGETTAPDTCQLCKSPFDPQRWKRRTVAVANELTLQLEQSRRLQRGRVEKSKTLLKRIADRQTQWDLAQRRMRELATLPSTTVQDRLRTSQRQMGYLDHQLDDLENKEKTAKLIETLSERKISLEKQIAALRSEQDTVRMREQAQLTRAYNAVNSEIKVLLRRDLKRQPEFEQAEQIQFDFSKNTIAVDGQRYFSASSRAVLRTAFFLGLMFAAARERSLCHPRLTLIDNIEDKGVEPERSRNLQRVTAEISANLGVRHQIILATVMIAPELDRPSYTVGRFFTRAERTLEFRKP